GDRVLFEMYDVLGKAVSTKEMDAVKGENKIELDASIIPDGIYFYSVAYKGQKLTKRMVITK
nr:T9SS type A sorting domain-containing protein [bacterium]